jgi:hypothetical protein
MDTPVLIVKGSLNSPQLIIVNTIVPTPNPNKRGAQISPLNPNTKFSTDLINKYEIGIEHTNTITGYF